MCIQLNNLAGVMEGLSKQQVYYDTSNETLFQSDNYEDQNNDHYIAVPIFDESEIICLFAEQLYDKKLKRKISNLLSDADLISEFHRLINNEGIYMDFVKFSAEIKLSIAKEWCQKNNITYTFRKK